MLADIKDLLWRSVVHVDLRLLLKELNGAVDHEHHIIECHPIYPL